MLGAQTTSNPVHIKVNARLNVSLVSNGGTTTVSSVYVGSGSYPPSAVNNGDRRGINPANGGSWADNTFNTYPDWVEIDFNTSKTLDEIDVFTLQDNYMSPSDPTPSMTFTQYGIRDFQVQYWSGSAWQDLPGGVVTNNNLVWRQFPTSITTTRIRILINNALSGWSYVTEVEAWGVSAP
jgi:hypothetical protein